MNVYVRYLFPDGLFKDVNKGTFLERAAALAYNLERRKFHIVFARRWAALALVLLCAAQLIDEWWYAYALFATLGTCCLTIGIVFLSIWLRSQSK